MRLLLGDCIDKLKELDDNSIDSIVTDPPYGLSFMGKDWDKVKATQETKSQVVKGLGAGMKMTTLADNIEFEKWVTEWSMECMRVLKPGGYMLAFGGSRMYHRLASGVENAGFEIRDQMMWVYGSGFPKSMNISKAIDKKAGAEREVIGTKGLNSYKTKEQGQDYGNLRYDFDKVNELTAPATDDAKQWDGWGTALKPAHEPIVMARKPLSEKTVVDNVLEWGTGGINIDDSRIGMTEEDLQKTDRVGTIDKTKYDGIYGSYDKGEYKPDPQGRFPANVIFDEEAGKILDEQTGELSTAGSPKKTDISKSSWFGVGAPLKTQAFYGDSGGASRFFYCPKTSKKDRNEGVDGNVHPTVKPTDLMLYLIRLVTPKGGTTLDPFMGSGSTGKAAVRGGFEFVGIEREDEYMEIAQARIQYEIDNPYNEEKGKRVEVNKNSNKFW